MNTETPADEARPFSEDVFQLLTAHSAFFDECATTLAKLLWEPLPNDDTIVGILALVPDPSARLVPTVAAELLSRSPNYGTYDQQKYFELLTAMSAVVVTSLVKEVDRRAGDRESAGDSSVRKWIARGEPTSEELQALSRGRRQRNSPSGKDEADSIHRAALAEHVARAAREHFVAPLVEQFRHMLDGFFSKVAWRADNVVRDALRKEVLRKQRELGVDSEQLAALESSATAHNLGFRVEWAEGPERAILLVEVRACPTLTEQERQFTELYLEDLTQVEIAKKLKISQPRVSQLKQQAIAKMREHANRRP